MPSQGRTTWTTVTPERSSALSAFSNVGPSCTITTAGLDQVEQIFQLDVILAHQRIGRRHRRRRQARLHRRLRHQRVLDRIAGENRDRTALLEAEIEQALRQRIDGALGFAIGHLAPLPVGTAALREPDALRRLLRPFRQRRRDVLLVGLQRNARLQNDDAIARAARPRCRAAANRSCERPASSTPPLHSHSLLRLPEFFSSFADLGCQRLI